MKKILLSKNRVFEDLSLFILRLFMGSTFLIYAIKKVENFDSYVSLFVDKLALPFPLLNLYIVILVEGLGGIMLILGLFSRIVSIPLAFTMVVAMFLVNIDNGFSAGKFGIEINLAYISILFILFAFGSGKFSFDNKLLKD